MTEALIIVFALIDCYSTINSNSYYPIKFSKNSLNRTENSYNGGSISPKYIKKMLINIVS